ncbi:MAG: DUF4389 domain-containing protein [Candidatus Bilamarchaeaceae archaeon]
MRVDVKLPFEEEANRVELFIRLVYFVIVGIIMGVLAVISVYIAMPLQFLYVLIFGKRLEILNKIIAAYVGYAISWLPYLLLLTDEKPDIMPKF